MASILELASHKFGGITMVTVNLGTCLNSWKVIKIFMSADCRHSDVYITCSRVLTNHMTEEANIEY